jgi:hypothetical protein
MVPAVSGGLGGVLRERMEREHAIILFLLEPVGTVKI